MQFQFYNSVYREF